MLIHGLDVTKLAPQFSGTRGRTVIIDGDGPCYVAAATAKRLDTALRRYQQAMLTLIFLTKAEDARIHLTAHNSAKAGRFRVKGIKPYQGQRKGKSKPALLEPLREAVALRENWLDEYEVTLHRAIEADDGMMIDAYRLGENSVVVSEDKDLRMTPYPWFDAKLNRVLPSEPLGWITPAHTPAGTAKLIGRGRLFFWAQMLMGDQADNIQGLLRYKNQKIGPILAYEVLRNVQSEQEAANLVLDAYRSIKQNPIAEGWLLWLLRTPEDSFWQYVQELGITDENASFLDAAVREDWFHKGEQTDAE